MKGNALVLARHEARILVSDPFPIALVVITPLLVAPFISPALQTVLVADGVSDATGAQQAVPGMAVTFALFLMGFVAAAYFREKEWKTWERLRSTPTSPPQLVAGKLIVPFALCVTQSIVLFAVGIAFLDLRIDGALWQLPLVTLAFGAALMCGGLLLAAVCRSIGELNAVASVGALLLAALGGAIVPVSTLPAAVQDVTPFVPTYWAVDGYQRVICGSGGSILAPCAELFALAVALAAIAIVRLRSSS